MDKKITLAELINIAIDYHKAKITLEDLNKFGNKIIVRDYLPIMEKFKTLMEASYEMNKEDSNEILSINLEMFMFFNVLLNKYSMIDISDDNLISYETYDLLYPIFSQYILQFCEKDYNKVKDMINNTYQFSNMKEFIDLVENINYKKIEESIKENKKFYEDLEKNKELISDLKEIANFNNPFMKEQIKFIKKVAKENIKKEGE